MDGQPWAGGLPRVLIGHSLGALAALALSAEYRKTAAVVTLNGPGRPLRDIFVSQRAWFSDSMAATEEGKEADRKQWEALLAAVDANDSGEWTADSLPPEFGHFAPHCRMLKSVLDLDPCGLVSRAYSPLLVVQGTSDVQVSEKDAELLEDAAETAGRPVARLMAEGLDHMLKRTSATGMDALKVYGDRRRRIPIRLIRMIAGKVIQLAGGGPR